jgi:hypothetical protein
MELSAHCCWASLICKEGTEKKIAKENERNFVIDKRIGRSEKKSVENLGMTVRL